MDREFANLSVRSSQRDVFSKIYVLNILENSEKKIRAAVYLW